MICPYYDIVYSFLKTPHHSCFFLASTTTSPFYAVYLHSSPSDFNIYIKCCPPLFPYCHSYKSPLCSCLFWKKVFTTAVSCPFYSQSLPTCLVKSALITGLSILRLLCATSSREKSISHCESLALTHVEDSRDVMPRVYVSLVPCETL